MLYTLAADLTVILHLVFIIFVIIGGLLVLKWRRLAYVHIPAAIWGALIEFKQWICPLTPLENWLRAQGGATGYQGGFIDHYLIPIIYPPGLTVWHQIVLGVMVLVLNGGIYAWLLVSARRKHRQSQGLG